MIPKFQVVDVTTTDNRTNIKAIILDDSRYTGFIFIFKDISLDPDESGIGVGYDLEIDIHKDHLPSTISETEANNLKTIGHQILEKIVSDLVNTINLDTLDNPNEE